jgi:hypothetical protein
MLSKLGFDSMESFLAATAPQNIRIAGFTVSNASILALSLRLALQSRFPRYLLCVFSSVTCSSRGPIQPYIFYPYHYQFLNAINSQLAVEQEERYPNAHLQAHDDV